MREKRINEIIDGMKSFNKETFHKSELLDEMLKLKEEIITTTFTKEELENNKYELVDVSNHFKQLYAEKKWPEDEDLWKLEKNNRNLQNLINAEISGNKGEEKALRELSYLYSQNCISSIRIGYIFYPLFRQLLDASL